MAPQDERRPGEPVAPDAELLRAALRATEARIARSSAPVPDHPAPAQLPGRVTPFHSTDDVAAVEHRVDHLAESFGEAMQAHARFRSWVTAAIEDLSKRVLGDDHAATGHDLDAEVRRRLDDLGARLDAFDEQAARMVTYLTGLADELQRRMDRLEARWVEPQPVATQPVAAQPVAAHPAAAHATTPLPKITLRPIVPPDPHRH